jgi:UDP-N-acetylmuramate: L-alanyl-gamma-D-glutamyl-meso-diaminopimelate ligase
VARVLLLAPPEHGAEGHAQLGQAEILARVRAAGVAATGVASGPAALAELSASLTGEEVVLLLSSGPLDGLAASLPAMMDDRFGEGS